MSRWGPPALLVGSLGFVAALIVWGAPADAGTRPERGVPDWSQAAVQGPTVSAGRFAASNVTRGQQWVCQLLDSGFTPDEARERLNRRGLAGIFFPPVTVDALVENAANRGACVNLPRGSESPS